VRLPTGLRRKPVPCRRMPRLVNSDSVSVIQSLLLQIANCCVRNLASDVNECERPEDYGCFGECINQPGTFQCQCPPGTQGNHTQRNGCAVSPLPPASSSSTGDQIPILLRFLLIRDQDQC
jgi:hypothetical protein